MKTFIKISSWLLLLVCAACTSSEEETLRIPGESEVCFTSGIRASSRATSTTFEDGDAISVFAFKDASGFTAENYAANRKYIYNRGRFVASDADNAIVYPEDESPLAFQAIYPYQASAGASFTFEVKEDQSINNNYTLSDLMSASTATTMDLTPHLVFSHRLSNIVLNLSFDKAPAGNVRVSFQNVTSTVSADMLTGTFKGTGGQTKTIRTASNGTNSFRAVLPPQSIDAGTVVGVITTDAGDSYTWELTKAIEWKSGIQYSYDLHVGEDGKVTFTAMIDPWGEPEEPVNPGKSKRLKKMVANDGVKPITIEFSYDAQGRMSGYTMPLIDDEDVGTLQTRFTYDGNKIISTMKITYSSEVTYTMTYTLNSEGNVAEIAIEDIQGPPSVFDLSYENGYLTSIVDKTTQQKVIFLWKDGLLQNGEGIEGTYQIEYTIKEDYRYPFNFLLLSVVDIADEAMMSAAYLNKLGKSSAALPSKITVSTSDYTDIDELQYKKDVEGYIIEATDHLTTSMNGEVSEESTIVTFYYE